MLQEHQPLTNQTKRYHSAVFLRPFIPLYWYGPTHNYGDGVGSLNNV